MVKPPVAGRRGLGEGEGRFSGLDEVDGEGQTRPSAWLSNERYCNVSYSLQRL